MILLFHHMISFLRYMPPVFNHMNSIFYHMTSISSATAFQKLWNDRSPKIKIIKIHRENECFLKRTLVHLKCLSNDPTTISKRPKVTSVYPKWPKVTQKCRKGVPKCPRSDPKSPSYTKSDPNVTRKWPQSDPKSPSYAHSDSKVTPKGTPEWPQGVLKWAQSEPEVSKSHFPPPTRPVITRLNRNQTSIFIESSCMFFHGGALGAFKSSIRFQNI